MKTQEPVAIVGMGCVLPDATGVEAFWRNLCAGHSAIRALSGTRWDPLIRAAEDADADEHAAPFLGAPVTDLAFDWRKFRVSPVECRLLHLMEMMAMEAADQAMTQAGYASRDFDGDKVAVLLGTSGMGRKSNQGFNFKRRLPEMLAAASASPSLQGAARETRDKLIEHVQQDFTQAFIEQSDDWAFWGFMSPVLGRISQRFNLKGPHLCLDAHAASGLAALEHAIAGLMSREWDMALVGAASPALSPMELVLHDQLHRLSRHGVFPLDRRADGTALGEGAVMLVVKRLSDAVRDGDAIQAVVRGVAGISQGHGAVPTETVSDIHRRAAAEALHRAGCRPDEVHLIECGALGVPDWDSPIIAGLAEAYAEANTVQLGAVAESVGDLQAASGLAALLKMVLAVREGSMLAPHSLREIDPSLGLETTPLCVSKQASWLSGAVRRASVHTAGFGGIAYHAVLEQFIPTIAAESPPPTSTGSNPGRASQAGVRDASITVADRDPIAIVGMACRYPGADSPLQLWQRALRQESAIGPISDEHWPVSLYNTPPEEHERGPAAYYRMFAPYAGLVRRTAFPHQEFGLAPSAVSQMDRTHLWALQVAREAVADAGYGGNRTLPAGRAAVIIGTAPGNEREIDVETRLAFPEFERLYRRRLEEAGLTPAQVHGCVAEARHGFLDRYPPLTPETLPGLLNSGPATRVAADLNVQGTALTVEAACASALAAVSIGVQGLRDARWDVAVVGGVWSQITAPYCVNMCSVGVVSPSGQMRPFSTEADGFVHGEGCGLLVLKRMSHARRDQDRIYGLIRGIGASTDGYGRSIYATQQHGQELAMRRALADAGLTPGDIQYIEAHGTGMAEGDIAEAGALGSVYGESTHPIAVAALKPVIGHSYIASGAAGLMRAVLSLGCGIVPPVRTGEQLHPGVQWPHGLYLNRAARPWPPLQSPRRAAVNAYGLGGANYHVILEAYGEHGGAMV